MAELSTMEVSSIAFYLPQYHQIAENDAWWGEGFTDWDNVAKARPRFQGHQQPRIPLAGMYDPRDDDVREQQARLATEHGITAFCYYHYWFNGRRLLEQPVQRLLASGVPKMPFMLAWANENWTRRWDGKDSEVLIKQDYSDEDDRAHIRSLIPTFADPRYATIGGRPIFLIYRALLLPNPQRSLETWRTEVVRAGLREPFFVRMESARAEHGDPSDLGFDAAVDFEPHQYNRGRALRSIVRNGMHKLRLTNEPLPSDSVRSYASYARRRSEMRPPAYPRFPGITPGWDNTARRRRGAVIFEGSTPELYEAWLRSIVSGPLLASAPAPFVFVNAWNEWAEGAHLEPSVAWGTAYLEAHARAIRSAGRP